MKTFENFKIDIDADGIAVIAFDVPGRSMNTLTSGVMAELPELAELIKTDESIKGAVITSGKASGFCAGADLGDMAGGMIGGASLQDDERRPARHRDLRQAGRGGDQRPRPRRRPRADAGLPLPRRR
jgi:enoyl-CoA hydratase/carnithine racemase